MRRLIITAAALLLCSAAAHADMTVTITDERELAGIIHAWEAYEASLPEVLDENGDPVSPKPGSFATADEYFVSRVRGVAASYADQMESVDRTTYRTQEKTKEDAFVAQKRGERLGK